MEKEQLNNLLGEMLKVRLLAPELKKMTYNDLIRRRKVYETTQNQDKERYDELQAEGFTDNDSEMKKLAEHIKKLDDLQEELNIIENVVKEMPLHELNRKIQVYNTRKNILMERKEELEAEGYTAGDRELDEVNNELFSVNELLDTSNKLKEILPDDMIIEVPTPTMPASTPTMPASTPTRPASTPTMPASTPTRPVSTPTMPASTPTRPVSTPTMPASTPTVPASTPTVPASTPTVPASTPTRPASTPTVPVSTPTRRLSTPTMPVPAKKGFLQRFKDRKEDKIVIGRKAEIVYNGKRYKANRKKIKMALQMNEKEIKDLFLEAGMDDSRELSRVDKAMKDDILDPVVVNAVCSARKLKPYQKRVILSKYINDISNAQNGRASKNESNVIYDLKDLGKASIIPRLIGREVDEVDKEDMLERAAIGARYGIARQKGEEKFDKKKYAEKHGRYPTIINVQEATFKPNLRARILAKITKKGIGTLRDIVKDQEIPARVYDEVRSKAEYHEIDDTNRTKFLRELKTTARQNGLDAYEQGQVKDLGQSDIKFYTPTRPTSTPTRPASTPTSPVSTPTTRGGNER